MICGLLWNANPVIQYLTDKYASRQFTAIAMIVLCSTAFWMGSEWSAIDIDLAIYIWHQQYSNIGSK